MPPPLVVTVSAKSQNVPVYIDGIGKCVALESVTITPRVTGQIIQRHFEDGAVIKKDQVLFSIDPEPAKAALASARAQLAQSTAAKAFAKTELDRYAQVAGTKAISKSDLDTKQNAFDLATAQVALAEAAVKTAELNLEYCTIISPIDGRAGARLVDVGNVVKANEGSLLSIQKQVPIYADFTINEDQLAVVRENMTKGTLQTLVSLPADKTAASGDLTFLDNAVQDGTGTVRLRALLKNADNHFWPGQFVNVRLVLEVKKDAVLVPSSAPQIGQTGPFVLVVRKDQTAEMRPVAVGQAQEDWIVIEKGIAAGEQVITDGQMMVRPNGPVRVQAPSATPVQTAAGDNKEATVAGGAK